MTAALLQTVLTDRHPFDFARRPNPASLTNAGTVRSFAPRMA
jgi:hypothetical protein